MNPLHTLSTRIAIPAGFFALISVGVLSFILIRAQREQVLEEVVHGSDNIAEAVLLSLDHDMRVNSREGVRDLVEALGRHAGIESIRIFNKNGEIAYSSRPEEVGRMVDSKAEACVHCHVDGKKPLTELTSENRSRKYVDGSGRQVLGSIHIIRNRPSCAGADCHAPVSQQQVLGVLDVGMSLEPTRARLAAATWNAVLISLAAVALITATLFFLIRRSVRIPLRRIAAATHKIAEGGAALAAPVGAASEFAALTTSFNEMLESLASSKQQLEEWANSLEAKVAEEAAELRDAQFRVIHAEKLSSVGLVAAGIAHELNSPLMAIITFSHLVKSAVPADSRAYEDLRMIEREANRCAGIIRQLLDYSRKQTQEPATHPCRVTTVIEGALDLLKVELQNNDVNVIVDAVPDLPPVDANEVQLMQVFVNLILNASQAMPDGGVITITANEVERRLYQRVELPPHRSTSLVRIVVRDTGTGIARDDVGKVFDPFFTTKPVGKGSGLGLSVSLGIVSGYRGTILVDSDGASWTEFTVLLPVSKQPALELATV